VWRLAGLRTTAKTVFELQQFIPGGVAMRAVAAWQGHVLAGVSFERLCVHPWPAAAAAGLSGAAPAAAAAEACLDCRPATNVLSRINSSRRVCGAAVRVATRAKSILHDEHWRIVMSNSIVITLPHRLGAEEAKRRIAGG